MEGSVNLYEAVRQMRSISDQGGTFSFKHRKYDRQRAVGGDLAIINRARLRPSAKDEQVRDAHRKLFYTDVDTGKARVCWTCLVTEFNGMKVIL